jgi:hypothetical protein
VLAERFIASQKLKVIENAQINANTVKSITNRWSNKMSANVLQLYLVADFENENFK